MQVRIRQATLQDAVSLRKLSIDSFVSAYAHYNTKEDMEQYLSENFSEEKIKQELADPDLVFFLAFHSEELAGYVKLHRIPGEKGGAHNPVAIARLYSRPEWIGQGIGKEILREVESYARKQGHDAICLDVWQKNFRAINFYQREGFVICGLTQFRLGNDIQDDFVMIRRIASV